MSPSDALHVLVVHNRYRSGQPSGEDRVVDQEKELLAAGGHRVESFERRSDDIAAMPLAQKAAVPFRVPWNPAVRAEFAGLLRRSRPDVVHLHNTFPLISPSVIAACTDVGVPVVATLHNYLLVCPSGTLHRAGRTCTDCVGATPVPALRHGCYRGSVPATIPLVVTMIANRRRWWSDVSRLLCISQYQRDVLARSGVPADRLVVKPNFVPDAGLRRAGPGEHLLYVGRLTEEKGVRLLMSAWDRVVARRGVELPLVIAGSGPLEPEVRAWADAREQVSFVGLRSRSECAELMQRALAVVLPSLWMETFGLVVVEAMSIGVPAVVADHGGLADLVSDGVNGLRHAPGDVDGLAEGLWRAATAEADNLRMGVAARARYEAGFTASVGLAALTAQYRSAIDAAHVPRCGAEGR